MNDRRTSERTAAHWSLDPAVEFLNHGSFGACPTPVLAAQREWRDRMEAEPVRFLGRELEGHLDVARERLAAFLGAHADDLAFVSNATSGVNTVLRSLRFSPGDEILIDDHEYNAVLNAVRYVADRDGARVRVAEVPFPVSGPGQVAEAILRCVTPRTRLAVISHVTSPTALVFPVAEIVAVLSDRGIDTLVDGAHAPGMVELRIDALGAAYYTGNGHKWLCGPKGAAFLHVRRDRQSQVRPLTISHGANSPRSDRSRFRLEFDWTGTDDPTPFLALPTAIEFMGSLLPGGWPELMAANHALALAGRDVLCDELAVAAPAPDGMLGAMATLPLPDAAAPRLPAGVASLADALTGVYGIEVPLIAWPVDAVAEPPVRRQAAYVRISAQRYNHMGQYRALAAALRELFPA